MEIKMKYVLTVIGLLIAAPYFLSQPGPDSIACSYDRIARSVWAITTANPRSDAEMARDVSSNSNCHSRRQS
jgi:hypothetical protein